jgi:hypothetical protein
MRSRLRTIGSLLLGLALWTSAWTSAWTSVWTPASSGQSIDAAAQRYIGAAQALAIGGQGMPSSVGQMVRAIVHVSHPAPRSALATCTKALASVALPRGHEPPSSRVAALRRPPALAFPYDATAPPVRLEI